MAYSESQLHRWWHLDYIISVIILETAHLRFEKKIKIVIYVLKPSFPCVSRPRRCSVLGIHQNVTFPKYQINQNNQTGVSEIIQDNLGFDFDTDLFPKLFEIHREKKSLKPETKTENGREIDFQVETAKLKSEIPLTTSRSKKFSYFLSHSIFVMTHMSSSSTEIVFQMSIIVGRTTETPSVSNISSRRSFTLSRFQTLILHPYIKISLIIGVNFVVFKPWLDRQHLIALPEHRTLHSAFENHKRALRKSDIQFHIQRIQFRFHRKLSCHQHRYTIHHHPMFECNQNQCHM